LASRGIIPRIVLTGQHPNLDLATFDLATYPRAELGCPAEADPHRYAATVARRIRSSIEGARLVVVQGDTSSALGGALGASMAGVPVAHVEAGLRSHDRENPWPEEDFRIAIDAEAELLFAPTQLNAANLRRENVRGQIIVVGNTGIDALLERMPQTRATGCDGSGKRRFLVTCHRRESWGEGLHAIADCLRRIADLPDVQINMVLHPNPAVAHSMRTLLGECPNLIFRDPCTHVELLQMMRQSVLILSDSGGIQEEAPAMGVPLLVLRDRTERPEGIAGGNALLVGRNSETIFKTVYRLLNSDAALRAMASPAFPYGDGRAASRIAAAIDEWLVPAARMARFGNSHNISECDPLP